MSIPFLLTAAQMRRIRPHFPLSHGIPRVDDRRVLSGIISVVEGGLRWRDAKELIGDRGSDSTPFREGLAARGITACIPSKKNRKQPIPHDVALYRSRYSIAAMFGRLKDWRRIATRYDRCEHAFFGAVTLAAIVIFWPNRDACA